MNVTGLTVQEDLSSVDHIIQLNFLGSYNYNYVATIMNTVMLLSRIVEFCWHCYRKINHCIHRLINIYSDFALPDLKIMMQSMKLYALAAYQLRPLLCNPSIHCFQPCNMI